MNYKFSAKKISFKEINRRLALVCFLLLVIFFISQIAITSVIGTKSSEVETIRVEKDKIRLQNEIITSEINELKSIEKIREIENNVDLRPTTTVQLNKTLLDNVALSNEQ